MCQYESNDTEDGNLPNRNQDDINVTNTSACVSGYDDDLSSDSDVTRLIKDSIARSHQNVDDVSIETKIRQVAEATTDIISEMPKIASRTVQIANKIVSVGKDSLASINNIKNGVSFGRHE